MILSYNWKIKNCFVLQLKNKKRFCLQLKKKICFCYNLKIKNDFVLQLENKKMILFYLYSPIGGRAYGIPKNDEKFLPFLSWRIFPFNVPWGIVTKGSLWIAEMNKQLEIKNKNINLSIIIMRVINFWKSLSHASCYRNEELYCWM